MEMGTRRLKERHWANYKDKIISMVNERRTRPQILRHLSKKWHFYPRQWLPEFLPVCESNKFSSDRQLELALERWRGEGLINEQFEH
jgi:hypothetical protein